LYPSICFVTGASTDFGVSVVKMLKTLNLKVYGLVERDSDNISIERLFNLGCKLIEGELDRPETYSDKIKIVDYIIHLAERRSGSIEELEQYNVHGTRILVESAPPQCRIIYLSTIGVYGRAKGTLHEDMDPDPIDDYSRSKLGAERVILGNEEIDSFILRCPYIIHPYSSELAKLLRNIFRKRIISKTHDKFYFVHSNDIAYYILSALSEELHGHVIVNIPGVIITFEELLKAYTLGCEDTYRSIVLPWSSHVSFPVLLSDNQNIDTSFAEYDLIWIPQFSKSSILDDITELPRIYP